MDKIKTVDIQRVLPKWAKVVKTVNDTPIYNMDIFENILSWNQHNLDVPAFDYYGEIITYRQLSDVVNEYICGFNAVGIHEKDIVTLCLPVSIENMISLLALNHIGAISNNVNYLFMKNDIDTYTRQKHSHILITLDAYLPSFVDDLEKNGIDTVILTSLTDYLPNNNKHIFDDKTKLTKKLKEIFDDPERVELCREKITQLINIRFLTMSDVLYLGRKNLQPLEHHPVDIERDISYSYTSGTTGAPKCIVYKEYSVNAFIEMHNGIDTKDFVGERVFQIIPLTHATGERFGGYLQLARGKTLVPQPIYNKETFGEDLMRTKCNWIVAAASFYLAGVAKGLVAPDAFSSITRPSSGGEPVTKSNVELINEWLTMNGCNVRFSIGGGAAEDGSGSIFSYFMDEKTRTNETGHPLEPHIKIKLLDEQGNVVQKGERGFLHVSSPAAADRYLNDENATAKRWYTDENGTRWGVTGDIAQQNADGSFNILGRADDSYIDKTGKRIYLFDIEYSLETSDPVIEWEITAFQTDEDYDIVGQVVIKNDYKDKVAFVVRHLCRKYNLDAVKIYDSFESSDVTGKRDFQLLKKDYFGYIAPKNDTEFYSVDYIPGKKPVYSEFSF